MKELKQDEIKEESSNDDHTSGPEEETELMPTLPNPEFFSYTDGQGKILILGSRIFHVGQLCEMSRVFLGLPPPTPTNKDKPNYTQ